MPSLRPFLPAALAFVAVSAVGAVLFFDLCDLIYTCGCMSLWAGGADHCNIQVPGPPDCPFCAHPAGAAVACFVGMGVEAGVLLRRPPREWTRLLLRSGLALLAFGLAVAGVGVVLGLGVGYWP